MVNPNWQQRMTGLAKWCWKRDRRLDGNPRLGIPRSWSYCVNWSMCKTGRHILILISWSHTWWFKSRFIWSLGLSYMRNWGQHRCCWWLEWWCPRMWMGNWWRPGGRWLMEGCRRSQLLNGYRRKIWWERCRLVHTWWWGWCRGDHGGSSNGDWCWWLMIKFEKHRHELHMFFLLLCLHCRHLLVRFGSNCRQFFFHLLHHHWVPQAEIPCYPIWLWV